MSKSKMVDADIRSLTADDMQDSQDIRYSLPWLLDRSILLSPHQTSILR